jgi:hypothetical protein
VRPLSDFAEWCIAVPALHVGHGAMNDAIAKVRQRRQTCGNVFQGLPPPSAAFQNRFISPSLM